MKIYIIFIVLEICAVFIVGFIFLRRSEEIGFAVSKDVRIFCMQLCLARAIYKYSPFIVLDKPTAALSGTLKRSIISIPPGAVCVNSKEISTDK